MAEQALVVEATLPPVIYRPSVKPGELRQGEILSNVRQFTYSSKSGEVEEITHDFVVVATQDCDLLWDFESRQGGGVGDLNTILLYPGFSTRAVKSQVPGSDIWKRVIQNKDERYHSIQGAPQEMDLDGTGLPDLVIDFKRYFAVTPDELYHQLGLDDDGARKRCCLEMPYREHFQGRAAFYFQRVTLPEPHRLAPVSKDQ